MKKVKFAIVGIGSIGKRHIAVLDAEPNAEIVAICDLDFDKAKIQSDLYDGLPIFTSYDEMLDQCDADVICVVTPHALHKEMTIKACNKKFNVLVEKPMALNVKDCMSMNEAAYKNGVRLWVVKQNRFNVPVKMTTEAISKGWLGKIFKIECNILWNRYQGYYDDSSWRGFIDQEGGALFTQASHFIDLMIWWGGDIVEAKAIIDTQNHNIETEDSGTAALKFSNGAIGTLIWTTCVYDKNYEGSLTIIGEKGTIKIGGKYLNEIEFWNVENHPLEPNIEYTDLPNSYGKYQGTSSNHDKVYKALINEIITGNIEVVDGFEGMKSIDAIEQIYTTARAEKPANKFAKT